MLLLCDYCVIIVLSLC